jgi:hypothetical protein
MKASLPITEQNGHGALFWIRGNDVHYTIVVYVGGGKRIRIAPVGTTISVNPAALALFVWPVPTGVNSTSRHKKHLDLNHT